MELVIHVDGGARGNPGPAGAGVSITEAEGAPVFEAGYFLGHQTNNAAEYEALIRALQQVQRLNAGGVVVHSDSELLVKQMTGAYQVKNARLQGLYERVQMLLLKIPRWSFRHVRREQNRRADELANLAMDRRADVVVFDRQRGDTEPPADLSSAAGNARSDDDTEPDAPSGDVPAATPAASTATAHPTNSGRRIRVTATTAARAGQCPAGGVPKSFTVGDVLPAGLCIHAVHALLPTALAMLNTDEGEFAAVPALTVRCGHAGCGAVFQLAPETSGNGTGKQ